MEKETLLQEMLKRDIRVILFEGVEIGEELELGKHSEITEACWNYAFETTAMDEEIGEEDYFSGISLDENNEPFAEWFIDGVDRYYPIIFEKK